MSDPRGKAKKALCAVIILGGASFMYFSPLLASASFFSFLSENVVQETRASSSSFNSQTMSLLSPATNINPNPSVGGGDIAFVGGVALLSQAGPSGTAADIESRPTSSQISVYIVRDGDTLSGIAKMFNVTQNTIIWANDIKGGKIHPGDSLIILPITGITHTVVKGDTLASLATTFKSDAHDIAQFNNLGDGVKLVVGDEMIIPSGERMSAVQPSSQKAASGSTSKVKTATKRKFVPAKLHGAGGPDLGEYYLWPVDGGAITQSLHGFDAVDIGASKGTDIFASADGVVIIARANGKWNGGYGNYIVIQHNNDTQTLYSHATKIFVDPGQSVSKGDVIAKVGATGQATGSHLHFEVRGAKNPFGDTSVGGGE